MVANRIHTLALLLLISICNDALAQGIIDNPKISVLSLTNGKQAYGEFVAVYNKGVHFRVESLKSVTYQPWNTIVILRTEKADYLPLQTVGRFKKIELDGDHTAMQSRLIGPRKASMKLQNGSTLIGSTIVVVPAEVAFIPTGSSIATTYSAKLVERLDVENTTYIYDASTSSLIPKVSKPTPATPGDNLKSPERPAKPAHAPISDKSRTSENASGISPAIATTPANNLAFSPKTNEPNYNSTTLAEMRLLIIFVVLAFVICIIATIVSFAKPCSWWNGLYYTLYGISMVMLIAIASGSRSASSSNQASGGMVVCPRCRSVVPRGLGCPHCATILPQRMI